MEEVIERIQNGVVRIIQPFSYSERAMILREVENFCGRQADEAMKMEYDMEAMEDMSDEEG